MPLLPLLAALALNATVMPANAQAPVKLQPGFWEITTKPEFPGVPIIPVPKIDKLCLNKDDIAGGRIDLRSAPGCKVIGVEPETADDATRSFKTGTLHTVHNPATIADGARTPSLGTYTFPLVRQYAHDMITVPDRALVREMHFAMERMKIVIEPTGALALAGAIESADTIAGTKVGVILSGGNLDLKELPGLLALLEG